MVFEPDIIVTSRDGRDRFLVVEVKLAADDLEQTERQIKRYMLRYGYPTGMLVTPDMLHIYRDTFSSYEENSVERVGDFSMVGVLDPDVISTVRAIEEARRTIKKVPAST